MDETPAQRLWRELVGRLDSFLAEWQRATQTQLTLDQKTRVYELFALRRQRGDLPGNLTGYGLALGPLLCGDRNQRLLFDAQWEQFWQRAQESTDPAIAPDLAAQLPGIEAIAQGGASGWYDRLLETLRVRYKIAIGLFGLVSLLLALGIAWKLWSPPEQQPKRSTTDFVKPPKSDPPKITKQPLKTEKPYLKSVPRRQPPPFLVLNDNERTVLDNGFYWLMGFAAALSALLGGLLWWVRRVAFESGGRGQAGDQIHYKVAARNLDQSVVPGFNAALAKTRFAATGQQKPDWTATVAATAKAGGFPRLVVTARRRQIDYVVITDSRHLRDQAAWLMRRFAKTLSQAQIRVHFYDFDRHPEWLWPRGDRMRKPQALDQVLAGHPGSRVLIVVDHQVVFYHLSDTIQDWVESLRERPETLLALLTLPNQHQTARLDAARYAYRVIDRQTDLGGLLRPDSPQAESGALDDGGFDRNWRGDIAPEQPKAVIDWLETAVGPDAVRLLTAMAMYPKLHGDLSFALFECLSRPEAKRPLPTAALLKTVTLPWCRQGWLPDWLRDALLRQQDADDYATICTFYQALFEGDEQALSGRLIDLDVVKPPSFWRFYWLKQLFIGSGWDSPLHDRIFAKVLLAPGSQSKLSLLARLMHALPEKVVETWMPVLRMLLLALLLPGLAWAGWHYWGKDVYGRYLLAEKKAGFANVAVVVRYHPNGAALRDAVGVGLAAAGFKPEFFEDDTLLENRIDAPEGIAGELDRLVRYTSWGEKFQVFSEAGPATIRISTMPQTGAVFNDAEPPQPVLTTKYPEPIPWKEADPADRVDVEQAKPKAAGIKPILPEMIAIPAGSFLMGSLGTETGRYDDEGPQRKVTVAGFQLAQTELTFDEWDRCVSAGACQEVSDEGWGRGRRPVINVSWGDAQSYIQWLNESLNLSAEARYRLPTEAEWEYAARAGTQTAYYWGEDWQCGFASGDERYTDCKDGFEYTAPVKQFAPNKFDLYDLSGNVWEWVEDCWHDSYTGAPSDASPWLETDGGDCKMLSIRGGSWYDGPNNLRSAIRFRDWADVANGFYGFRLARTR